MLPASCLAVRSPMQLVRVGAVPSYLKWRLPGSRSLVRCWCLPGTEGRQQVVPLSRLPSLSTALGGTCLVFHPWMSVSSRLLLLLLLLHIRRVGAPGLRPFPSDPRRLQGQFNQSVNQQQAEGQGRVTRSDPSAIHQSSSSQPVIPPSFVLVSSACTYIVQARTAPTLFPARARPPHTTDQTQPQEQRPVTRDTPPPAGHPERDRPTDRQTDRRIHPSSPSPSHLDLGKASTLHHNLNQRQLFTRPKSGATRRTDSSFPPPSRPPPPPPTITTTNQPSRTVHTSHPSIKGKRHLKQATKQAPKQASAIFAITLTSTVGLLQTPDRQEAPVVRRLYPDPPSISRSCRPPLSAWESPPSCELSFATSPKPYYMNLCRAARSHRHPFFSPSLQI